MQQTYLLLLPRDVKRILLHYLLREAKAEEHLAHARTERLRIAKSNLHLYLASQNRAWLPVEWKSVELNENSITWSYGNELRWQRLYWDLANWFA